ncbi:unnamed protein product [Rotaria magnacalcarata]|uniref:Uncharacterized protein n=1 Tax=Rotaria magnacalcarata TaxID=392030 RepID=A0A819KX03_9BILA|nr:unnamed protein product [Rotaria magnacalcarata]CAF1627486.1 unnamed protein product [Rotaria magnacalcarata]CAF2024095.1 unnamed protein product [Rotaria magnacalcarata]CAF2109569.1 unnamed protein product [Rotaria magnacalcarata]CAF2254888.1 unnamed protein product [Rotaria magnacalcarata]
MTEKANTAVSWFVQSYYKACTATAILSGPIINQTQNSMTLCKVLLYGLKPSDINYSSNDKICEIPCERQEQQQEQQQQQPLSTASSIHRVESSSMPEADYLNLHIKPLATPTSSRSLFGNDTGHESSPIRVMIRETSRGRHRICVSQTLLRAHNSDD